MASSISTAFNCSSLPAPFQYTSSAEIPAAVPEKIKPSCLTVDVPVFISPNSKPCMSDNKKQSEVSHRRHYQKCLGPPAACPEAIIQRLSAYHARGLRARTILLQAPSLCLFRKQSRHPPRDKRGREYEAQWHARRLPSAQRAPTPPRRCGAQAGRYPDPTMHLKLLIDEIDRLLTQHYRFTEEQLNFINNYDIKYQMGVEEAQESA
jgi:hypothetical protein